jgi:hypothetical protein
MTPNELADELGIDPKALRHFLRTHFPRSEDMKWKRWKITKPMARKARVYFA